MRRIPAAAAAIKGRLHVRRQILDPQVLLLPCCCCSSSFLFFSFLPLIVLSFFLLLPSSLSSTYYVKQQEKPIFILPLLLLLLLLMLQQNPTIKSSNEHALSIKKGTKTRDATNVRQNRIECNKRKEGRKQEKASKTQESY
jgi:hypothetical protein